MTAPAVKNCGSCRWLKEVERVPEQVLYLCYAPPPASIIRFTRQRMLPTEGTTCPCYAPREGGEETR